MCVVSVGFSSFFNGLVVFTILGFMAKESGMPIDEVAKASGKANSIRRNKYVNIQHGYLLKLSVRLRTLLVQEVMCTEINTFM